MNSQLREDILNRLSEFDFKEQQGWLRQGRCPACNKKELYTNAQNPWVVRCGRLNKCGYEASVKELYPDLFEKWSDRYKPSTQNNHNPNAAADAYLNIARGFDLELIQGYYTQESYYDSTRGIGSATVRFPVAGSWWERLIDQPSRFGNRKAGFATGAKYKGQWWCPPRLDLSKVKQLWIVEGIFNAIALLHHDIVAVSIMSCNNYPEQALDYLAQIQKGKSCELVWALDNDPAGMGFTKKHHQRALKEGWLSTAVLIPTQGKFNRDWNDLHLLSRGQEDPKQGVFGQAALENYRYHGKLLIATSAVEKGFLIHEKTKRTSFDFEFNHYWYWFDLDYEKFQKTIDRLSEEGTITDMDELRQAAMFESKSLRQICNCTVTPLYYQSYDMTDESWYYTRILFPHAGKEIKNTFTASQLSSATEFKKRLLAIAPGGVYSGTNQMLDHFIKDKLFNIKRVQTIDFIGYSKEHHAYIFNNVAVKDGKIEQLNSEDFFDFNKLSIKSLLRLDQFQINTNQSDYKKHWFDLLYTAYGVKGVVVVLYFFASLFAEQIRAIDTSFPFLEVVGQAATGKSTLIEFCWKLLGRDGHEGIDPEKATHAARARSLAQVANLPVVLIESDRASSDSKTNHHKKFEWDELKTAYNGRSVRSRGVATSGNETYDPPFRGSIVISQNEKVMASEAIMQRICHLYFTNENYTEVTRKAALQLARLEVQDVSGFILSAITKEEQILSLYKQNRPQYDRQLMRNPKVHEGRLAVNHSQLMACADALRLVIPMSDTIHQELLTFIEQMTVERQSVINDDHPIVQEFWEVYEYLNGDDPFDPRLNHSSDPTVIAINLNEYVELAVERRQQIPPLRDLKIALKSSRRFKYQGQRCVHSAIKSRHGGMKSTSTRCWLFSKQGA